MEVIPGILEKEWSEIERKIELVRPFTSTIHIDIIDGKFAPNTTFIDPSPFKKFTSDLFFELHMMVDNPIQYLKPFARAGFKRFVGHIEAMHDQEEFLAQGQLLGEVGLAVDGPTNLSRVRVPYEDLDSILVMTIKAGESGQMFEQKYLGKVKELKKIQDARGGTPVIEVDGGINDISIVEAKMAGASRFVSTTFIFNPLRDSRPQAQFDLLQERIHQ